MVLTIIIKPLIAPLRSCSFKVAAQAGTLCQNADDKHEESAKQSDDSYYHAAIITLLAIHRK